MENNEKKVLVFCANDQKEMEHSLDINGTGEVVLTCGCGRFLKYPKGTTAEELIQEISAHKEANSGQITVEAMEEKKKELIDAIRASEEATQEKPEEIKPEGEEEVAQN